MADLQLPYFLARPTTPVQAGVVVIHEGNGMSPQLLRWCERLAGEGYAVAAPDLFFRSGGPAASTFQEQIGAISMPEMRADLESTAELLRGLGAAKVGVTGFCMGGRYTWHAAANGDGWDAAVGFYGGGIAQELGTPRCPTLLFFGGSDPHIPRDAIAAVEAHHADTTVYETAGHGFMRDGSDDFHPEAAADAWAKTLAHFRRHLLGT